MTSVSSAVRRDYTRALRALRAANVPFVIGGAWAVEHYVALGRATLDLDLMLEVREVERAAAALEELGAAIVATSPLQLRVALGGAEIELVHHFARGAIAVDHGWYERSRLGKLFGVAVRFAAPEDLIWSKLFIASRNRFDGADVVHLLRATHRALDWSWLRVALEPYPELLLAYLSLFAYCYPNEREPIPRWVLDDLFGQLDRPVEPSLPMSCRGSLIDHASFEFDYLARGFVEPELAQP